MALSAMPDGAATTSDTQRLSAHPIVPRWRLGVATRILGAPLRSHDSRRWAQAPHLSVSLAYLRDILAWLGAQQIGFYRLSGTLAPYATHPDMPQFHRQLDECQRELAAMGEMAQAAGIRLTMHPAAYVRLDAAEEGLAQRSQQELAVAATLLDAMGLGEASVIVVHAAESTPEALARFARRFAALPERVRARLVLENGDRVCALPAALWLQRRTGAPIVLDLLHHRCNNPAAIPPAEALRLALATWPPGMRPKLHLSSPRTEMRLVRRARGVFPAAPLPRQHSDFVNPFECIELLHMAAAIDAPAFDIMVEAKAHDLAVLRLRAQVAEFAPEFAGRLI